MDRNIKMKLNNFIHENIVRRKAMFIPIAGVATFMLVGYAAVDKESPEIISDQIEISYGEKFDTDVIDIKDNRDSREDLVVEANTSSLNTEQLGSYEVEVTAYDQFSNETTKTVIVEVVDQVGPQFETLGSSEGYVVTVPVKGSNDFASYVKATDNVDGDVTPFITADKELDTSKLGSQTITLTATDTSGNETRKTIEFAVSDTEAPVIHLTQGSDVTVNYGSSFDLNSYVSVTDNFDTVSPIVEGTIDTKKEDEVQKLKISAKDNSGNESQSELNVTVKDTQAPVVTLSKSNITINAGESVDLVKYLSSATDNKDGDLKAKVSIPTVNTANAGTKTVTYTVSDAAGNTGSASLTIKINKVYSFSGKVSSSNKYGSSVVSAAYSRLGCPYVYGASGPNAFDCSGLVQWCYAKAGKSVPHSSSALRSSGTVISVSQAQPGDILWKPGHVGIYIGGGKYIHAPHTGDVVKISSDTGRFTCAIRPN